VLEDPLDISEGIANVQATGNTNLHLLVSYCSHCTVNRLQQSAQPSGEPQHTPQIQQQQQQQQQHFSKPAHSPARSGIVSSSCISPSAGRAITPTAASAAAAAATGSSGYLTPQARSPLQRTPAAAPYSASAAEQYRSVQHHKNISSSSNSGTIAGALRSAATSRVTALRSWSAVKQHAGEHEMCNSGSGSGSESCSSSGSFDGDTGASHQHQVISCLLCYACIQSAASCGSCCSACATGFSLKLHIGFTCAEQTTVHHSSETTISSVSQDAHCATLSLHLLQVHTAHSPSSGSSSSDARTAALLAQMAALRATSTSLRCHTLQVHASPPPKRSGLSHTAAGATSQQQQQQQQQQRVNANSSRCAASSSASNANVVAGADSSASAVRARLETARTKLQLSSASTA
jgi:hypothetical protein